MQMSNLKRQIPKEIPSRQKTLSRRDSRGNEETKIVFRNVVKANIAKDVEIFADEQNLYHLLMRKKENDPVKKEYVNRDTIQSFNPVDFAQMNTTGFLGTYDEVVVLHDPTKAGKIDSTTFYSETEDGLDPVAYAEQNQIEEAERILADNENAKTKQALVEQTAANVAAAPATAGATVHVPTPDQPGAGKTTEEIKADTKDLKKDLAAARKEFKKLYEADADEAASLEELVELINAKKGTTDKK